MDNVVVLDRGDYTSCTINLHGATVTSWIVKNKEQLFVSLQSVMNGKLPIRGGVPFVFSKYGEWVFGPDHGFARIMTWNVTKGPERLENGDLEVTFSSTDNDFTRAMWNFEFKIDYRLLLAERELHFNIAVQNPSKHFTSRFNLLLHTYVKVPDVTRCEIAGLKTCKYTDKTRTSEDGLFVNVYEEHRDVVTIEGWTDRTYQNTPKEHVIKNVMLGRKMRIQKYNFPDTIIWNPWIERSREMSDFRAEEYVYMVCVEAGHVTSPVILLPGTSFEAGQILQLIP